MSTNEAVKPLQEYVSIPIAELAESNTRTVSPVAQPPLSRLHAPTAWHRPLVEKAPGL
jgi:hypothetical protein